MRGHLNLTTSLWHSKAFRNWITGTSLLYFMFYLLFIYNIFLIVIVYFGYRPLLVDLTIEEGTRLKVIYGSADGFHAVDLDSAAVYDIYLPKHVCMSFSKIWWYSRWVQFYNQFFVCCSSQLVQSRRIVLYHFPTLPECNYCCATTTKAYMSTLTAGAVRILFFRWVFVCF